jgi:hypothetical protein
LRQQLKGEKIYFGPQVQFTVLGSVDSGSMVMKSIMVVAEAAHHMVNRKLS